MMRNAVVVVIAAMMLLAGAGCAARRGGAVAAEAPIATAQKPATTHPADDPAYFTLDQIQPTLTLPTPRKRPTTEPVPLDALQWYAQARAATARGDRNTAINLLERAVSIDPDSPEIYEELGKAYGTSDKALEALNKAVALDPNNLSLHERLGRQYLLKNRLDDAVR